jgi:hypothetical protein
MRNSVVSLLAAVLLAGTASIVHADNSQQEKMKECNAHAGDKKGDERKAFMQSCLSAGSGGTAAAHNSQQEKMKTCNADASKKHLKGDERKTFMKGCLSGG